MLDWRVEQFRAFDGDVFTVVVHGFAFEYTAPDAGEFHRGLIALFVAEEQAITGQFLRVAAGHQIEQGTTTGQTIQRCGLTCCHGRGNDAWAQCHQKFQALSHGDQRCRHQPRVFAGAPGGDQHPAKAQAVCRLCHLLQVAVVDGASAFGGAKVMAITVGRQEPENIEAHGVVS